MSIRHKLIEWLSQGDMIILNRNQLVQGNRRDS
ncbi:hypothetical protein PHIM7_115 [Sinorhizobium phage phiM7]|uniref:Uncharacterized protein n=2 Tax=Emdodecavirus TaxID=1980937 RepID=A0A0R8UDH4_9CAUD|nr:hypothetical protein AVT40_gp129 [Sinorhizobium phage phiN3]YP_009601240.1 hypothetical protein FDH46_gp115 [Sinorhizobium phage phiM7]AKF13022.1 hypothetical protein PHIM19_116 [Sinorhizobium phage phiM19]AKZ65588.1 hypothetical protein PHIM7_115 [Sinorhizobium phage phiM7]AKZ65597.1 hypothetical protein PHIN3_129 [Sinorhizobium phage phiN3]